MKRDDFVNARLDAPADLKFDFFRNWRGQSLRYAYVSSPEARGVVVLLPGRTEFIEKYYETMHRCLQRGYAIAALDWIDHGLSDRSLPDRVKCHSRDFADYVDDLRVFVLSVLPAHLSPSLKRVALGTSMGGHIALRTQLDIPTLFNSLALCAPMFGIKAIEWMGPKAASIISGALTIFAERTFSKNGEQSLKARENFGNGVFSHDPMRDRIHLDLCKTNPSLVTGDPTFGWVHAAIESCKYVSGKNLSTLTQPVFMALGGAETIVDNKAAEMVANRLPNCETLTLTGAGHEILMETDALQTQFWQGFDRLLARTI